MKSSHLAFISFLCLTKHCFAQEKNTSSLISFEFEENTSNNYFQHEIDPKYHRTMFLKRITNAFQTVSDWMGSTIAKFPMVKNSVRGIGKRVRNTRGPDILENIYEATGGERWIAGDGWLDPDREICDWEGVICNHYMITGFDLSGFGLQGTIPDDQFRRFPLLETLDLSNNRLSGTIPKKLSNLINLRTLNLADNSLTGEIPFNLRYLLQLQTLDLSANNLQGTIPNLRTLVNLEQIFVQKNALLTNGMDQSICSLHGSWALAQGRSLGFDLIDDWCNIFLEATGLFLIYDDCGFAFDLLASRDNGTLETIGGDCFIGNVECLCCTIDWKRCCYDEIGEKICLESRASQLFDEMTM